MGCGTAITQYLVWGFSSFKTSSLSAFNPGVLSSSESHDTVGESKEARMKPPRDPLISNGFRTNVQSADIRPGPNTDEKEAIPSSMISESRASFKLIPARLHLSSLKSKQKQFTPKVMSFSFIKKGGLPVKSSESGLSSRIMSESFHMSPQLPETLPSGTAKTSGGQSSSVLHSLADSMGTTFKGLEKSASLMKVGNAPGEMRPGLTQSSPPSVPSAITTTLPTTTTSLPLPTSSATTTTMPLPTSTATSTTTATPLPTSTATTTTTTTPLPSTTSTTPTPTTTPGRDPHCPKQYIFSGKFCFRIFNKRKMSHGAASKFCRRRGKKALKGRLPILDTEEKFKTLRAALKSATDREKTYWVGLKSLKENEMRWDDGSKVNPTFWAPDEPSDPEEECGDMRTSLKYKLNDVPCKGYKFYAVCEIPL